MDKQYSLFSDTENKEKNKFAIGHGLILEIRERSPQSALLFVQGVMVKKVNLSDKIRKKIFMGFSFTLKLFIHHRAVKSWIILSLKSVNVHRPGT